MANATASEGGMGATRRRITLRTVEALRPGEFAWDSEVKGFGVRCQREAKVYVLKTRIGSRQRWFSIGRHGSPWTPDTARREALRILGQIANREDPAATRDARRNVDTMADLAQVFLAEHVDAKRKVRTAAHYRDLLERVALPALGSLNVTDVARADIARMHHALRETPYQANRAIAVLSKMIAWAEKHGYRPEGSNPCRYIEKYPERKRERFLSEAELAALAAVLNDAETSGSESPYVIAAIRLLIFTGARLSEILGLKWEWVDHERTALRLPDSKTGAKTIYLNAPALAVLADLKRIKGNPYVIAGGKDGRPWVNLQKPWRRIRRAVTVRMWAESEDRAVRGLLARLRADLDVSFQ